MSKTLSSWRCTSELRQFTELSTSREVSSALDAPRDAVYELATVWRDGESVQVRAVSAFGDPVDMGSDEAQAFASGILDAARAATS